MVGAQTQTHGKGEQNENKVKVGYIHLGTDPKNEILIEVTQWVKGSRVSTGEVTVLL